jgi:type IV secretion system protein VirB4
MHDPNAAAAWERSGIEYVTHFSHIADDVGMTEDGTLFGTIECEGYPHDLAGNAALNAMFGLRCEVIRSIADADIEIYEHLVQHDGVPAFPAQVQHRTVYGRELAADWERECLRGLRCVTWLITVMVRPGWQRPTLRNPFGRGKAEQFRQPGYARERRQRRLENAMRAAMTAYEPYRARRLGVRIPQDSPVVFDELAEAHQLVLSARWKPIPMVADGAMGASIYTQRVICSTGGFRFEVPGVPDEAKPHGTMVGFRVYPRKWRIGMFDGLIGLPFRFVLTNHYRFLGRSKAGDTMADRVRHMENAGDRAAESLGADLDDAIQAVDRGEIAAGRHLWALAVHADCLAHLAGNASDASAVIVNAGGVPAVEDIGMEGAFWSQMPGAPTYLQARAASSLPSPALAAYSSLHAPARGDRKHYWKRPVYRARTIANTAYDMGWHIEDVGMRARFGPIGSGKTLDMAFDSVMLDPLMGGHVDAHGKRGTQVIFDKDGASEILTKAMGGPVARLRLGDARGSGAAPGIALPNTAEARAWLHEFLTGIILDDGRGALTPVDDARLADGIAFTMRLPPGLRAEVGAITSIRQYMTHGDPLGGGARLDKWCRGGALGWAFDGFTDEIDVDAPFASIDPTALLKHASVMPAMAAYCLHRVDQITDGRRLGIHADEFRAYLPDVRMVNGAQEMRFARGFENFALTGRKLEVFLDIATQQPEHVLSHPVGPSLIAQCKTRVLYRNPDADPDAYMKGLGCSARILQAVKRDMLVGPRSKIIMREDHAVRLVNDLSAIAHHIPILSARKNTVDLLADTIGNEGKDPAVFLPAFRRRLLEIAG